MFSDSDDDKPLARTNGYVSEAHIPKSVDKAMDKAMDKVADKSDLALSGIAVFNGPADDAMDVDGPKPATNGTAKRKSRSSTSKPVNYKDEISDDDAPLAKRHKTSKTKEESDSDDDMPLAAKSKPVKAPPKVTAAAVDHDSSDDEEPLKYLAKKKAAIEKQAAKEAVAIRAEEAKAKKATSKKAVKKEGSDSEENIKPKKRKSASSAVKKKTNGVKKEESDSDTLIAKKKTTAKKAIGVKKEQASPAKKAEKETSEEAEQEVNRWWKEPIKAKDGIFWNTLQHNGVVFPPPYELLPKGVKLLYDGVPINLSVEAEEIAGFFGIMLNSKLHVDNPTFQKNFFADFTNQVKKTGGAKDKHGNKIDIKEFSKLDFKPIFNYYDGKSQEKKARSSAEKKAEKAIKDAEEAPYVAALLDGRIEPLGNFRIEPPGLFRGRGQHPKTGKVKRRVAPEQITINIGKEATVPAPPVGHKWKGVQHDNKVLWLAMWQENINGDYKYIQFSAKSSLKGQSDLKKFEKARDLKKYIKQIRDDYTRDLRAELMADRQRATAIYLIDEFALRAGNEKDAENEAETVGCCSLKYEHVTLTPPNTVTFDFLGKDSILFHQEVMVSAQVFKNLKMFKKEPKGPGDDIFDRLTTTQLNKHLTSYMPGLSAKVFRTYNASYTMSKELKKISAHKKDLTTAEKIKLYNDCNREVAKLCNHKRAVAATHGTQLAKMEFRIKGLRYQQWRTKQMILDIEPKQKKKKGAEWFELDPDLDEAWILDHQAFLVQEQRTKIQKKFQKENEELAAEGKKEMKTKELAERMAVADELEKKFKKEFKTKKVEAEGKGPTVEKYEAAIGKLEERIATAKFQRADKDENAEVALGTSKINYIDPRLTVVFSKEFNVPIERFFSKTLRDKFNWAIEMIEDDDEWEF